MAVKNSATLAEQNLCQCKDINLFRNWLSNCGGEFLEALANHKQLRSLLDDNVYRFMKRETEFNSIAYQLDEIERDLKILYRKTEVIGNRVLDKSPDESSKPWMKEGEDLIETYRHFQIKWNKVWHTLRDRLGLIFICNVK